MIPPHLNRIELHYLVKRQCQEINDNLEETSRLTTNLNSI